MKKVLLLVVVFMMATVSMNAQNGYDNTKHEVAVSYGYFSTSQWFDVFQGVMNIWAGGQPDGKTSVIGPISGEYFYHVKNWLGVGAVCVFGRTSQEYSSQIDHAMLGKDINTYYSLMPAVKFDWLRFEHFGLYSKIAFGATLRSMAVESYSSAPSSKDNSELAIHPNFQASPLGMEFGGTQFRGFVEFGLGEQGSALIGLRYKF